MRDGLPAYLARYLDGFGPTALSGLRIGVYQHSSVARDFLGSLVTALGGVALPFGRTDMFVPVDTEALAPDMSARLADWADQHDLDAVISTDGDGDRPLLADQKGRVLPGDVLGVLTADMLGADHICTPVTSNRMVEELGFASVTRTRVGSPFVIAAMRDHLLADPSAKVVGYEANGGFLLGYKARGPAGPIPLLMTRDAILPILAPLYICARQERGLSDLIDDLPAIYSIADRLTDIDTGAAGRLMARLCADADLRSDLFGQWGRERDIDLTDGLCISVGSGDVIHLRQSGNAPELRCYAQSASLQQARAIVADVLARVAEKLLVA